MNGRHDPIAEAAARAVQGVGELRDENARLAQQLEETDRAYEGTLTELKMARQSLMAIKTERDSYQRFTIEVVTQMGTICDLINKCFKRSREIAQNAPNGAHEPEQKPAPAFLSKGRGGDDATVDLQGAEPLEDPR